MHARETSAESDCIARLQTAYAGIAATRMAGSPIANPVLRVETVAFREWDGRWIGMLVTPWSISLVLLPGNEAPLERLEPDEKRSWTFPSGAHEFTELDQEMCVPGQICTLLTPLLDFPAHEAAVSVAREMMSILFAEAVPQSRPVALESPPVEAMHSAGETNARSLSRRDFLRGAFFGR